MTLKINGVEITIQPTEIRWLPQSPIGTTGDGHLIYPAVQEAEIRWQVVDPEVYAELVEQFNSITLTGTVSISLPDYTTGTYSFRTFENCILSMPEMQGAYFEGYIRDVVLYVRGIRV